MVNTLLSSLIGDSTYNLNGRVNTLETANSGATASAVGGAIVKRDGSARAQVADPSAPGDIATRNYVDVTAGTSAATASALMRRDAGGRSKVATPIANDDAANRGYVDDGIESALAGLNLATDANPSTITGTSAVQTSLSGDLSLAYDVANDLLYVATDVVTGPNKELHIGTIDKLGVYSLLVDTNIFWSSGAFVGGGITVIDGNVWVIYLSTVTGTGAPDSGGHNIKVYDGTGASVVSGAIGTGNVFGICDGPGDGYVWAITGTTVYKLLKADIALGTITATAVHTSANSAFAAICVGPDGNLWVSDARTTANGGNAFLKITPTGTVTTYTSGLTSNGINGIRPNSMVTDGVSLWTLGKNSNRLIKCVAATGTITEYTPSTGVTTDYYKLAYEDGFIWINPISAAVQQYNLSGSFVNSYAADGADIVVGYDDDFYCGSTSGTLSILHRWKSTAIENVVSEMLQATSTTAPNRRKLSWQALTTTAIILTSTVGGAALTAIAGGTRTAQPGLNGMLIRIPTTAISSDTGGLRTALTETRAILSPILSSRVVLNTNASQRFWFGLVSADISASDSPSANHVAAFRASTSASDTTFKCVTANGSSVTVEDSLVTWQINRVYDLQVRIFLGCAHFIINGQLVKTIATTLPSSTQNLGWQASITTLSAAIKSFDLGPVFLETA